MSTTDEANLVVHFLVAQLAKGLFGCDDSFLIVLHGVDDVVVSHTSLNDIVVLSYGFPAATGNYIVKPLKVVLLKYLEAQIVGFGLFSVKHILADGRL